MNYADFTTQPNGFPLESDATLGFMQASYTDAIRAVAKLAGNNNIILTGMEEAGGNVADGWILYGGDVIFFQGGTKSTTFIITEEATQKANENGTLIDRYFVKKAQFGSGPGSIAFSTLERIQNLRSIYNRLLAVVAVEPAVILTGMVVSNVSGGNCDISAGSALIDGLFVDTSAYSGAYPVYLKPDGQFTTSVPSGVYVTFDPHTSQRYANVIDRATTPAGRVVMTNVVNDRFDGTGLGKWEMKGYALCNGSNGTIDLRSRFIVGYDNRLSDPGGNLWDIAYNTVGQNGGEKAHALTIAEMPAHNHTNDNNATTNQGEFGLIRRSITGENKTNDATDTGNSGNEPDIVTTPIAPVVQGSNLPHENRPPFTVLAFVQRI